MKNLPLKRDRLLKIFMHLCVKSPFGDQYHYYDIILYSLKQTEWHLVSYCLSTLSYEFLKNKIMMVFVQVYIKWRVNESNITASNASFNAGTAMQNHYTLNYTLKRIPSLADAESTISNGFFLPRHDTKRSKLV